ncbi:natural killer cells antigen CD94-like isoform X2 [Ahaetulla prasina]|uniref:natural killer cells antigen CD94-like isoform X2 n=1 Tax=Ahaetulla prasina TaxID=499056 RepID=UPI0026480E98|nr:natural killer cells antigen CD94-like isoform X2 [Ahaetulla prasina]
MLNMDVENQLVPPLPNGSASEQEKGPDHTTPGMLNMDVENQSVLLRPNGSASEQEKEPDETQVCSGASSLPTRIPSDPSRRGRRRRKKGRIRVPFKTIKQRLLPASCQGKKAIIGIVFSGLVFCSAFGLGTLVSRLNCQKDAIKCPPDWIGHQGHCYKFSDEEKNWNESQNICMSHNASLAKITEEEMDFVKKFIRGGVFWIGLKKELDQLWKWLDGENSTCLMETQILHLSLQDCSR